jgi:hypothetical protein
MTKPNGYEEREWVKSEDIIQEEGNKIEFGGDNPTTYTIPEDDMSRVEPLEITQKDLDDPIKNQ